jgi:hypothetical protein
VTVLQRLEGSAYRDGRLACARVIVAVVTDAPSARHVLVRFVDTVDQQLCGELQRLMARRGAFAIRLAEQFDPVQIIGRDADGTLQWRLVGRLERPAGHSWRPVDAEFWLRECNEPTTHSGARPPGEPTDRRPASLLARP